MSGGRVSSQPSTRIEQLAPELEKIISPSKPIQHLADGCLDLALFDASHAQRQRDIIICGEIGNEAEILKNDANPPTKPGHTRPRQGDDIFTKQADQPAAWPLREIEQLQKRCLSGTRWTGEKGKGACRQAEADIGKRLRAGTVAQTHIFELHDACHRARDTLSQKQPRSRNGTAMWFR